MIYNRPSLRQPVRVQRPAPRIVSARAPSSPQVAPASGRKPVGWDKERRRGVIAVVTVAFVVGGLVIGYGVHAHMSRAAARLKAHHFQVAMTTLSGLQSGTVLFVPEAGDSCRRRWIDNTTWTLRDGGEVPCEDATNWQAPATPKHRVEMRLDAIRSVFQARGAGKIE